MDEIIPMQRCPNPDCRATVDNFISRLEINLYGPDGQTGLSGRAREIELGLSNKVSRPWLLGTFLSAIGIMCVIFIPMITGAIKTIGTVSDRSIASQVQVEAQKEELRLMDSRAREAHITLLNKGSDGDKFIIKQVQQANEDMRKHIDRQLNEIDDHLEEMEVRITENTKLHIDRAIQRALSDHYDIDKKVE